MKIQIVNVDLVEKTGPSGKPYQLVEVTYKNLSFQGKVEMKPVMPFGATADTAKVLKTSSKGDLFTITKVKNDKGYIDWTAATPEGEAPPEAAPSPAPKAAGGFTPATQVAKNTYETPEERAKKQIYIVRQSSITAALTFLNNTMVGTAKELVTTTDVLAVAKEFENYVFGIETLKPTSLIDTEDDLPE